MPATAALTINDGLATPVAHTFSPNGKDHNGVNYYYDRVGGIGIGFPRVSLDLRTPTIAGPKGVSSVDRVYRVKARIVVPVLETTSAATGTGIVPAPTKAYDVTANIEFVIPERAALSDREDILAYATNLLSDSVMASMVENLEGIWG